MDPAETQVLSEGTSHRQESPLKLKIFLKIVFNNIQIFLPVMQACECQIHVDSLELHFYYGNKSIWETSKLCDILRSFSQLRKQRSEEIIPRNTIILTLN